MLCGPYGNGAPQALVVEVTNPEEVDVELSDPVTGETSVLPSSVDELPVPYDTENDVLENVPVVSVASVGDTSAPPELLLGYPRHGKVVLSPPHVDGEPVGQKPFEAVGPAKAVLEDVPFP